MVAMIFDTFKGRLRFVKEGDNESDQSRHIISAKDTERMFQMDAFNLASLPGLLTWRNEPVSWESRAADQLTIVAGPQSDYFANPADGTQKDNAPGALFAASDPTFLFHARVRVDFGATYDAGTLMIRADDRRWAKLAFEYSPQREPMVVSVVTRETSDDCNSVVIAEDSVYLRIMRNEAFFAFHYSLDGRLWHFVRQFSLGPLTTLSAGLAAQSPMGEQCRAEFSEIAYRPTALSDLRNGE